MKEILDQGIQAGLYQNYFFARGRLHDASSDEIYETEAKRDFDIASLTKLFVTAPALIDFCFEKNLDPLKATVGDFDPHSKFKNLTLASLLSHTSGLRAWRCFFLADFLQSPSAIECWLNQELFFLGNKEPLYSDIGYILLAFYYLKASGETVFARQKLKPQENIHDDNARFLNKVLGRPWVGHAGAFCSGEELLQWARELFLARLSGQYLLKHAVKHALGFRHETIGEKLCVGHYGFTGCAFWLEPQSERFALFLSDRFTKTFTPSVEWKEHRRLILSRAL